MTLNKIIGLAVMLLLLSNCTFDELSNLDEEKKRVNLSTEPPLIDNELLIDNKRLIKESSNRNKKLSEVGPVISDIDTNDSLRQSTRHFIDKDEAFDYVNFDNDDDSGAVFPIDINVENIDIRTFAKMMSEITGINILVSDEVSGVVTAKLHDVPWPSVLDSVLSIKSLAKHIDKQANIIRIHTQDVIVKLESFQRQRKEDLQRAMLLKQAEEPLFTEIFKLFYTKPETVKTILEGVLGVGTADSGASGVRNTKAQITVDERKNSLIVKARKDDINIVDKLISKVDSRTKQVFIEAFIVEVTDDFEKALGVRLGMDFASSNNNDQTGPGNQKAFNIRTTGLAGTAADDVAAGTAAANLVNLALASATGGIGLIGGLGNAADLKFELTALEKDGFSKVVSNPKIFTLDNQEAIIFQGSEIPYETTSADGTSIQFKEAGLRLAVTPTVVGDGNLLMSIAVNKDTADTSKSNPPITKSEITTNLVTKDGSIVVIGGIYTQTKSDSIDKVPLFGDLPVVGAAFRKKTNENDRKELMIFIAPRII